MQLRYLPRAERKPDNQYRNQLRRILNTGEWTQHPFQEGVRRKVVTTLPPMVFDLRNGFPLLTERYQKYSKSLTPIKEMIAFIHGARTGAEMKEWGCGWWKTWTTPEKCATFGLPPGDMGPGSYGAAFHAPRFEWEAVENHPDGGRFVPKPFNQFEHLVQQMREYPRLSTHKISTWIPHYCLQHSGLERKVVVAPCHGDIQITLLGKYLDLNMTQRSGDFPVGVGADIMMYAWLPIALAQITGYIPRRLVYRVVDAHFYENQLEAVKKLVSRKRKALPFGKLHITKEGLAVKNLLDFRAEHFEVREYEAHSEMPGIPVTE
jgi:thymidylate synthase